MRRFNLLNSNGAVFDLMRKDAFFHRPSGLGKSRDVLSSRIGDFMLVTENKISHSKPITGEMVFRGYQQYTEFIEFLTDVVTLSYCPRSTFPSDFIKAEASGEFLDIIANDASITETNDVLHLEIPDVEVLSSEDSIVINAVPKQEWRYRDCTVATLEKSEISHENRRLVCPIELIPITPWYKPGITVFSSVADNECKQYSYKYPYTYGSNISGEIEVINSGKDAAPCRITIYGPCVNPLWSCAQNAVSIASGAVNVQLSEDEYLVIDANPLSMEIAAYYSDGTKRDCYQNSDFTRERFISVPPGTSQMYFSHSGDTELEVTIEVREYADTV